MNVSSINKIVTWLMRISDTKKSTEALYESLPQKTLPDKGRVKVPLERATPESVGIPSQVLCTLLERINKDNSLIFHNLMIIRHGKVVLESGVGGFDLSYRHATFSECKSFVSLAIGCLIDEGRLTLDTRVIDIFPKLVGAVSKIKLKKLTVKHLLTMTSSVEFSEIDTLVETQWKKSFLNSSTRGEIGTSFKYNSLNSYMLAAIVCEISGKSLSEYLDEKIFSHLGIEEYYWEKSPEGIEKGGWGVYMLPEDTAKIAMLVMNRGKWGNKQLVSEEYISEATRAHCETPDHYGAFNYGYHIWCGKNTETFLFNGMFGQNALGFMRNGIIVIMNGGNCETFQSCPYYKFFIDAFDRDFDDALPISKKETARLSGEILSFKNGGVLPKKQCFLSWIFKRKKRLPTECDIIDKQKYNANDLDAPTCGLMPMFMQAVTGRYTKGIQSVRFEKEADHFYFYYTEKECEYKIEVGFNEYAKNDLVISEEPYTVFCKGRFAYNEDNLLVLIMKLDFASLPSTRHIRIYFGSTPKLYQYETPGGDYVSSLVLDYKKDFESQSEGKLLSAAIGKIDNEYLKYKIARIFSPDINLSLDE